MKDKDKSGKNPVIQSMLKHLAEENISPEKMDLWPALRTNLAASRNLLQTKEFSVNKRFMFTALAAVLVLAIVAIVAANTVTSVSAKEVLDRAYQAQSQSTPTEGISHIRNEIYSNYQALPEDQGMYTTIESYRDLQTGNFRNVTVDNKTGRVLDALAYDGSNTYSQDYGEENANSSDLLTIYRTPQGQVAGLKPVKEAPAEDASNFFNKMRQDPNVQLLREETWEDGRTVYVLQSHQQVKTMVKGQVELPLGKVTAYFDVNTYEQLGYRMTMERDGEEILLGSQKILINETLPAGTNIAWDLSDVQGIVLVDDPNREHGDLLPEVITPEELAVRTESAYLLETIPDGYALEISEPQIKAGSDEPYIYIASYRTEANDYFVIQSTGPEKAKMAAETLGETYTTTGGLTLTFLEEGRNKSDQQFSSAIVETPEGTSFLINSTLSQERVKELAEDLVLVSK